MKKPEEMEIKDSFRSTYLHGWNGAIEEMNAWLKERASVESLEAITYEFIDSDSNFKEDGNEHWFFAEKDRLAKGISKHVLGEV